MSGLRRGRGNRRERVGAFVAMRGFEWSSPTLGHINVWGSRTWTDPLATAGIGAATTAATLVHAGEDPLPGPVARAVNTLLRRSPENRASMAGFYDWLRADPDRPLTGGGNDALAGFNHPGREAGRFGFFAYERRLADRIVSLEMFDRSEDYLYEQVDGRRAVPAGGVPGRGLAGRAARRHRRARDRVGVPRGAGPLRLVGTEPRPGRGPCGDGAQAVLRHA